VIFDPPPRRRAVLRYVLPILIGIAVVVALVVSSSGEETRAELAYLEELDSQSVELAKSGDALRDVVTKLSSIDRVEFVTVIEGIREDLDVGLAFVEEDPLIPSVLSVRSQYRIALETWSEGINQFETAVLEAADQPESVLVVDLMAESLAELRAGDELFASLIVDMRRDDVPSPLTELSTVILSPAQGSLVSLSVVYIRSARSPDNGLALRPGLAVSQLVSDPQWQVNPSDQVVVPTTEAIVFSAVISNLGNIASDPETLVLTLLGGPEQVLLEVEVPVLNPTQQLTIPFEAVAVTPGGVYEVTVRLVIAGADVNPEDNDISVQFTVNEG